MLAEAGKSVIIHSKMRSGWAERPPNVEEAIILKATEKKSDCSLQMNTGTKTLMFRDMSCGAMKYWTV